jgi:hypothetical protein
MEQLTRHSSNFENQSNSSVADARLKATICPNRETNVIFKLQTDEQALLEWNARIALLREQSKTCLD